MSKRITVDPISRIEGHLRVDVEVDNGAVSNAWASATFSDELITILVFPRSNTQFLIYQQYPLFVEY